MRTLDDTLSSHYVRQEDVVRALEELTRVLTDRFDAEAEAVAVLGQRLAALARAAGADAGRAARAARASVTATAAGSARGPVLFDVQATQSASHRDRGVARYTAELAAALWRGHPELVHSFLLNPDLAPPGAVEPLVASGRLAYSDRVDCWDGPGGGARILHVASPFELDVPISRLWPAAAATRGLRLVVTLYDLIPELFAERYLADPGLRRRYRVRLELVRAADAVLAISETTARDAVELLHIPEHRIVVVGAAASAGYTRPVSADEARAEARARRCPGSSRASCSTRRAWTTGRTSRGCSARGRGCPPRCATGGSS